METVYNEVLNQNIVDDYVAKDAGGGSVRWTELACVVENNVCVFFFIKKKSHQKQNHIYVCIGSTGKGIGLIIFVISKPQNIVI